MKKQFCLFSLKRLLGWVSVLFLPIILSSCDPHEWPEEAEITYDFTLSMDFSTELPLYKEVYYSRGGEEQSRTITQEHDLRYKIQVYQVNGIEDDSRIVYKTFFFTRKKPVNPDYTVHLELPAGDYRFRIWADYVSPGTIEDKYYDTSDFSSISLADRQYHQGSNEYRDAFMGTAFGSVYDPDLYNYHHGTSPNNSVVAEMKRPMGRYEFISTDMEEFLTNFFDTRSEDDANKLPSWSGLSPDQIAQQISLSEYKVVFSYNAFMPSTYNIYTDRPTDSWTNVSFESSMEIGEEGMILGFDYLFVADETLMNLNMDIYNASGERIASTSGVQVPVVRNKNTVVKGKFLTATSSGGVSINPGYDGDDYNIEIN